MGLQGNIVIQEEQDQYAYKLRETLTAYIRPALFQYRKKIPTQGRESEYRFQLLKKQTKKKLFLIDICWKRENLFSLMEWQQIINHNPGHTWFPEAAGKHRSIPMLSVYFLVLFWIGMYFFVFVLYFFHERKTLNSVDQEVGRIWEELGERKEYDLNILNAKKPESKK